MENRCCFEFVIRSSLFTRIHLDSLGLRLAASCYIYNPSISSTDLHHLIFMIALMGPLHISVFIFGDVPSFIVNNHDIKKFHRPGLTLFKGYSISFHYLSNSQRNWCDESLRNQLMVYPFPYLEGHSTFHLAGWWFVIFHKKLPMVPSSNVRHPWFVVP